MCMFTCVYASICYLNKVNKVKLMQENLVRPLTIKAMKPTKMPIINHQINYWIQKSDVIKITKKISMSVGQALLFLLFVFHHNWCEKAFVFLFQ